MSEGPRGGTSGAPGRPSNRSAARVRSPSGAASLRALHQTAPKTRANSTQVATSRRWTSQWSKCGTGSRPFTQLPSPSWTARKTILAAPWERKGGGGGSPRGGGGGGPVSKRVATCAARNGTLASLSPAARRRASSGSLRNPKRTSTLSRPVRKIMPVRTGSAATTPGRRSGGAPAAIPATSAKWKMAGASFCARLNFCCSLSNAAKFTSWATSKAAPIKSSIWPSRLLGSSRLAPPPGASVTAASPRRRAYSRRPRRS